MADAGVRIAVDAGLELGPLPPIWSWFGYDEPNYTTMPHGRALLGDLARLREAAVHVRVHNLLTSGDGTPALKWGSTGIYDEDDSGAPRYRWDILDGIFDVYAEVGIVPFVQLGFMPRALSVAPEPYQHDFPRTGITAGWAYPPRDYGRWAALVEAVAEHLARRYGRERAASWPWELWNEPDGLYWRGSVEAFCRLFDVTAAALRRVLPAARIGGPHTCGPFSTPTGGPFLRRFLEHCDGGGGARPDFIAFHAKGRPTLADGRAWMGLATQLRDIETGVDIVRSFPAFRDVPVIIGESDPEGCAACPASTHPENAYRDGPTYAAYVVESTFRTREIAERAGARIEGAVTWAFEFEGAPIFAGYRELATHGIAKPVLNAFRMMAMMGGTRLAASSSGALPLERVLADGVRAAPDINVLAARGPDGVAVLAWHYHDGVAPDAAPVQVELAIDGLASGTGRRCEHLRIDAAHSNAHAVWRAIGAPRAPTTDQYAVLAGAAGLAVLEPQRPLPIVGGSAAIAFTLPRHAVSLFRIT